MKIVNHRLSLELHNRQTSESEDKQEKKTSSSRVNSLSNVVLCRKMML